MTNRVWKLLCDTFVLDPATKRDTGFYSPVGTHARESL